MGVDSLNRAVFLDRDGVLNAVVFREGQPCSPRSIDEFRLTEDIGLELTRLDAAGFRLIVATNQPDIARGLMPQSHLDQMSEALRSTFPVTEIQICPHDNADSCDCRKPKAGMLTDAARRHDIDLSKSFMIGDTIRDCEAARNAGCTPILIGADYNTDVPCRLRFVNLHDAVNYILQQGI